MGWIVIDSYFRLNGFSLITISYWADYNRMTDLLRNTYTLIAGVITVCTLGSFGGVSLYIIQQGFADQERHAADIAMLKSVALLREERDNHQSAEISQLRDDIKELRRK